MGTTTFVGSVCSVCFVFGSLLLIIPSVIIVGITKDRDIQAGFQKNNSSIPPGGKQWIPFSPIDCPKEMSQLYQTRILTFLQVKAPNNSRVTLFLYENNDTTSPVISKCSADTNDQCALLIPQNNNNNISAFLSLSKGTESTVEWGCYYLNLPIIVSSIVLGCSGCLFLFCLCSACLCCLACCCDDEFGDHKGAQFVSPHVSYHRGNTASKQSCDKTPLVIQQHVETGYVDGAKVIRHYSTVGENRNGRASQKFVTDDSSS